jgi:hypothetical protein
MSAIKRRTRLITVCDRCLRAVCWYGEMMCNEACEAGTVQKTARELRKLDREHPDYFSKPYVEKVCGGSDYAALPVSASPAQHGEGR